MTEEKREQPYGRRITDIPAGGGKGDDPYVRRSELAIIIEQAVRKTLNEYNHECIMCLRPDDVDHVRDLFTAIREVGHGDTETGIQEIRENHTLLSRYRKWSGNIGTIVITTVILAVMTVMGSTLVAGAISWIRGIKP